MLCFLVSTLFVFLLSLMLGLTSLRCWDLYIARAGPRSPPIGCRGSRDRTNPPMIGQAARVPLLAAAELRHGDQDGPHGAAQLPAGVPGWRGPQGVTGVWSVQLYIVILLLVLSQGSPPFNQFRY